MKGRVLFKSIKPILNLLIIFVKIFPNFLKQFLWDISSKYSGKLFVGFRYVLLKAICKSVGDNVYVGKYTIIKNAKNIEIGNNVSIHDFCYLEGIGGIYIGNEVSIAHNCSILSANHTWEAINVPIKYNKEIFAKVVIQNDVWIGCGVRILAGVSVNKRSIVAAGAVVTKTFYEKSLIGGVPAKLIKTINE
ncbi:acetyltransferase [Capnocytophaga stomatis]|uniref:acyltransferase n=1 Tax=Capnocytophaga stomatis TaxID=1848904 RepID=UPI00195063D3|nr:acyltransferase [Capnocytophaga stomatis]GIJ97701.1 acetyltransferase [Capnocytophaga stomatis]GIM48682.1 acetyltransferase [Capnocytophaga stomatis]